MKKNHKLVLGIITIVIFSSIIACSSGSGGSGDESTVSLEKGESINLGSVTVGSAGSLITVDDPESLLNGMEIEIPRDAYPEAVQLTVSYSPILNFSGNENLDPVSPLIKIENGCGYSEEIIAVKIPVRIEEGYHYMAFYYDDATGSLEGIPGITHDASSLTLATRHFSNFFVNRISNDLFFSSFVSNLSKT